MNIFIKFFYVLILLIFTSINLKSKECINTDILKIGIIENDYIDYKYYLYYMLGEYTHSKSIEFELKSVENNIDEFDIIFGEYYDLYNLSINKINLPDKIKNFYNNNELNITENLLPLDLDTFILLSKSEFAQINFEDLVNHYDNIKYTLGFSIKSKENLYKMINHILDTNEFNFTDITVESKLDLLSKSYKNLNRSLIKSNFLEIYNSYEDNENVFTLFSDGILLYKNIDYSGFQLFPKSQYFWNEEKGFFENNDIFKPVSHFGFSAFINNKNQTDFICFLLDKDNRLNSFKNFNIELSPLSMSEVEDIGNDIDNNHKLILESKNKFIKSINTLDKEDIYKDLSDILLNKKSYEDIYNKHNKEYTNSIL